MSYRPAFVCCSFTVGHGTNLALIEVIDGICRSIDSGKFVCGVFLDLQKAFDTVQHNILLHKLFNYGVRGIAQNWFHISYLNQRCHYNVIGKVNSPMSYVNCGIQQGSVLGPLLFLVYINDIEKMLVQILISNYLLMMLIFC